MHATHTNAYVPLAVVGCRLCIDRCERTLGDRPHLSHLRVIVLSVRAPAFTYLGFLIIRPVMSYYVVHCDL